MGPEGYLWVGFLQNGCEEGEDLVVAVGDER